MAVYWQIAKQGQRLMLADGEREVRVGGVRVTAGGFDAHAMTFGYEPERAQRDMASMEEAKTFVESFKPWELHIQDANITVEIEVRAQA
jgi:hypothetical protein